MFNLGFFAMIRNLIHGFGGWISAFARSGNMIDKLAQAGEKGVDTFLEEIDRSQAKARLEYEASLEADKPTQVS